jgi:hypothetical protein
MEGSSIIKIFNIGMVDYCNGGILRFESNGEIIPTETNAKDKHGKITLP